ncbi:MBL fold metallo-hydrolase [Thioalkalivibrio paradoxus]|uniref:MBL fold metallo-hydrolase n=1 Tax=Thioalkalivibrio paradoxus TaxID=108010 RepID=UPI00022C2155|nr:rhodanese-like domain-containing protein [Thioalkalivibrio paradoxus]
MHRVIPGTLLMLASAFAQAGELTSDSLLAAAAAEVADIDTQELQELIADDPRHVVIDVRTQTEVALTGGMIRSHRTLNIPRGWLEFQIGQQALDPDTPIVVYCGQNLRSPPAAQTLQQMGFANVRNYAGGYFEWKEAGLPLYVADKAPDSFLYSRPEKVTDGVWSAIGATQPHTYENSGHNNNLSFVITDGGVLVVNAGDNYLLAKSLHDEIRELTDQPVKYVVLENGQGHAMLGMTYWQDQGVPVIAHVDAAREIEENGPALLAQLRQRSRDKAFRTRLGTPDKTFTDRLELTLGGETIEILNLGPAHSPGDIVVWLPERKVVISGDVAFHERLLPVFEDTDTAGWIETWDRFVDLGAEIIIPGHGGPVEGYEEVTRYTRDYLVYMREQVAKILDAGGDLNDAYQIDQSAYAHLDTFHELSRRNAALIFQEMEFEALGF